MTDNNSNANSLREVTNNQVVLKENPVKTGTLFLAYSVTGTVIGTWLLSILTSHSIVAILTTPSSLSVVSAVVLFCVVGSIIYPLRQNLPAQYAKNQPNLKLRLPILIAVIPFMMVMMHYGGVLRVPTTRLPVQDAAKTDKENDAAIKQWKTAREAEKSQALKVILCCFILAGVVAVVEKKRSKSWLSG